MDTTDEAALLHDVRELRELVAEHNRWLELLVETLREQTALMREQPVDETSSHVPGCLGSHRGDCEVSGIVDSSPPAVDGG